MRRFIIASVVLGGSFIALWANWPQNRGPVDDGGAVVAAKDRAATSRLHPKRPIRSFAPVSRRSMASPVGVRADGAEPAEPAEATRVPLTLERPGAPSEPLSPEEVEARERAEVERAREFHDDRYEQEDRDVSWAVDQEQAVQDFLAEARVEGTSLDSVECRTTRCRLVMVYDSPGAHRKLNDLWGRGPFRYGSYFHLDLESNTATVYTGREGVPFAHADLSAEGS